VPAIQIHARLSHFTDQTILVPFTISGTAASGLDYEIANTTLTFLPGSAQVIAAVEITDDVLAEGTEFFLIQMQESNQCHAGNITVCPDQHPRQRPGTGLFRTGNGLPV
jgi:hypothetical protein